MDREGLRLSRPAFSSPAFHVVARDTYRLSQQEKVFVFHVETSSRYQQSAFPKWVRYWLTWYIKSSILTWTYHVFDKLKVIIMGDGYGFLGYGAIDTTLLWGPLSISNGNSNTQVDEPLQYSPKPR